MSYCINTTPSISSDPLRRSVFVALAALGVFAGLAGGCRTATTVRAVPFLSPGEWTFVTPANGVVDAETTAPSGMGDLCYAFACAWYDDALIVLVLTIDDDVSTDSCKPDSTSCPAWDDDAVEIFLDGECARLPDSRADGGIHLRHGGEFALVANGAANSDYSGYPNSFCRDRKTVGAALESSDKAFWTGEVKRGADVDCLRDQLLAAPGCPEGFWPEGGKAICYTFLFPWRVMGRADRPDCIGFNIGVQDDDGGGRRDHTLYWTGTPHRPYVNESAFGTLILNDDLAASGG